MRNLIVTIVGRKGSGKSWLVREILADFDRVIILDTMGEYGARDEIEIASGFGPAMAALELAEQRDKFRFSIRVEEDRHALAVADVVYELRNVLFVVEEASAYLKPQLIPTPFKRLVRMGRHHGISQLYVAQRPAMLHRDITSQSDVVVTFQQHAAPDVEYLRDVFGDRAEEARTLEGRAIMAAGPGLDRAPRAVKARLRGSSAK